MGQARQPVTITVNHLPNCAKKIRRGKFLHQSERCGQILGLVFCDAYHDALSQQEGGVSRSPDGLFAQQEREPIRGRPAVRGKRTYGGRPGQCVKEQGTWASRTQKHSEAGYGQPVDRGAWTAKTVKRPRQQPAHPQYANYWAPLTRKRHTMPHSAQPQHTNYWAPRTRKRHQQEHRPQRPTESSNPAQHAKGRTGDPVKEQQSDGMSHRGSSCSIQAGVRGWHTRLALEGGEGGGGGTPHPPTVTVGNAPAPTVALQPPPTARVGRPLAFRRDSPPQ